MARKNAIKIELVGEQKLKERLQKMGQAVVRINRAAAEAGAKVILDAATPKAPGPHLGMEVVRSDEDQAEVAIGPDKEHWYYQFFETGAGSHEISPKNRKALAFPGRDGDKVTGGLQHPGMPAEPFLRPAMQNNEDEARDAAGKTFRAEIEKNVESISE